MNYRMYYAKLLCIAIVASCVQPIAAAGQTLSLRGTQNSEHEVGMRPGGIRYYAQTKNVNIMIYNKSDKPLYFGMIANASTIVRPFVTVNPQSSFIAPLRWHTSKKYDINKAPNQLLEVHLVKCSLGDFKDGLCFSGLDTILEGSPQSGLALTYTNPSTTQQQDFAKDLYPLKITYDAVDQNAAKNPVYNCLIVTSNAEGKPIVSKPIYAATPDEALRKAQEEGVRQTIKNVFK